MLACYFSNFQLQNFRSARQPSCLKVYWRFIHLRADIKFEKKNIYICYHRQIGSIVRSLLTTIWFVTWGLSENVRNNFTNCISNNMSKQHSQKQPARSILFCSVFARRTCFCWPLLWWWDANYSRFPKIYNLNEALIYAVTSAVTSADTSAEMAEQAEHLDEKFPYLDRTENWLPKP